MSALCGEIAFFDDSEDVVTNPSFICEVLSPSTEAYDRGEKFENTERLAPFANTSCSRNRKCWPSSINAKKTAPGACPSSTGPRESFQVPSIQCEVRLADLYDKVVFKTERQRR